MRPIDLLLPDHAKDMAAGKCAAKPFGCGGEATSFKDELSEKEFSLSGLCQKCQDKVFGTKEK